jgi:hypothetical protein
MVMNQLARSLTLNLVLLPTLKVATWTALPAPCAAGDVGASKEQVQASPRSTHWSLAAIGRPKLPEVGDRDWPARPIDYFVLGKLESAGLSPSPTADRRALIRRAKYDLLGLPPTPQEVEAFLADGAPDAYERLVDRFLASPRYGERWGRHWLDVARYADTRGYAFARERRFPYSYTYRDYVIRAFNEDLSYDRFILEQIAADRLDLGQDNRSLAALGFLTVGRRFNNIHDDIDDRIDVVSRGLMGLSVSCARCHDHKYDAIPSEDYYSLYGVFASSSEPDELPLVGNPEETPGYEEFKEQLDKLTGELEEFKRSRYVELVDTARKRATEYVVRAIVNQPEELLQKLPYISLGPDELRPQLVERWREYLDASATPDDPVFGPLHDLRQVPDQSLPDTARRVLEDWSTKTVGTGPGQLNPLVKAALLSPIPQSKAELAQRYGELFSRVYEELGQSAADTAAGSQTSDAMRQIWQIVQGDGTPTDIARDDVTEYFNRADEEEYRKLEKKVHSHQVDSPGAPPRAMVLYDNASPYQPHVFLRGNHARRGKAVPRQFLALLAGPDRRPFTDGSGRLELARAIIAPENPLTRRVVVNRVWMHHFGQPLVETPSDFGVRCDEPTHAQLLDCLACALSDGDWSLKALHRQVMLSNAYRQSSADRADCRRVDPDNRLVWRMNRQRLEFEPLRDSLLAVSGQLDLRMGGRPEDMIKPPYFCRRAIYGFIDRQDLPNLLRAFDVASPDQSSARRPQTTVPQQALFLMNSPLVAQVAKALIARPDVAAFAEASERVDGLYRLVFGRPPTGQEVEVGQRFVEEASADPRADAALSAWEQYAQLLLLSNEFMFID